MQRLVILGLVLSGTALAQISQFPSTSALTFTSTANSVVVTGANCATGTCNFAFSSTAVMPGTLSVVGSITSGAGGSTAGIMGLTQGTLPGLGTTQISFMAPTSVTSYGLLYPGAAPAANQVLLQGTPASGISTGVFTTFSSTNLTDTATIGYLAGTQTWTNTNTFSTIQPNSVNFNSGLRSRISSAADGLLRIADSTASNTVSFDLIGPSSFQWGAADAAAPVAQLMGVQNVIAGTSNTAGADWTIKGSRGTGTGAGGAINFQVSPASGSGSTQNALVTALGISGAGIISMLNLKTTGAATGKTVVCVDTATGILYASTSGVACAN